MGDVFRPATVADAVAIVPHLRQADIDECDALVGEGQVLEMATATVASSIIAYAWEHDGRLIGLFGCAGNLLDDAGTPWMIGTDAIEKQGRALIRIAPRYIQQMKSLFPQLANVVDVRNRRSINWLKRMGFRFHPATPLGPQGLPFYPFTMGV